MSRPDLNLLVTLDVLLAEGSVARAARRLRLSPSAMSRSLARLRETTGDPLLVRAGRGLVPTPRALELRERVGRIVEDGVAVLRPAERLDLTRLARTFALRTSEGFVENFGAGLVSRAAAEAPGVRLRFVQKPDKDSAPLREGAVDLETGVVEPTTGPELRARALFVDRLVGVVRAGHPLIAGEITAARYAAGRHVNVSRHGAERGEVDEALDALGLARGVATIVDGFASALALARGSDLIASVPSGTRACCGPACRRSRSGRDFGVHGVTALAPAPARGPGAPLAACPGRRSLHRALTNGRACFPPTDQLRLGVDRGEAAGAAEAPQTHRGLGHSGRNA
jgi:DNA-binding transcriptional LysR family regulator